MKIPKNKILLLKGIAKEGGIILLVIIIGTIAMNEMRKQINIMSGNIKAIDETNKLREYYNDTFSRYHNDVEYMADAKRVLINSLPPTEDVREFVGILNTLGTKNAVEINTSVGATQVDSVQLEGTPLRTIPITISIKGPLENVRNYISDIEKLPYFFTIISLDERSVDSVSKQRLTIINAKLWTKPEQAITKTQSQ